MRTVLTALTAILMICASGWAQAGQPADNAQQQATTPSETTRLRQEIEQLKKTIAAMEDRLNAQEKQTAAQQAQKAEPSAEVREQLQDLDKRVSAAEVQNSQDRLRFSGDYRFEGHSLWGNVPAHFDGMKLQNLVVKALFAMPVLGRPPMSVNEINSTVANHAADYQQFANNLTFAQLKQAMASFPADMQQQMMGMLMPSTYVGAYKDNNKILYTNRLRLKFDSKLADNVTFSGRLSMYKTFGDSTGVQVFNGQPNSMAIDGATASVPNSDMVRVERAYFSWNDIGGSKLYLSIGRRPSTYGPPLNYRQDELRGGTPSGSLIDFQFDGMTLGYHFSDKTTARLCYGVGYESGWGNASVTKLPQDRLKDVHLVGANIDFWNTEKSLVQFTYAHAFNVTDGFNGLMVLPVNPVSGDPVNFPAVLRYTPSANLGAINLAGINITRKVGAVDLYMSANLSNTRPNGLTTPFGGLMSDPFEQPVNRAGSMVYVGGRYNFGNDERTKLGFEFNHGSKYWFNFAQAEDDIVAPKTNTRGNVYEAYFTHRLTERFVFKADMMKYLYGYSGSGWHVGAPKKLSETPVLGFPTWNDAFKLSIGLLARF